MLSADAFAAFEDVGLEDEAAVGPFLPPATVHCFCCHCCCLPSHCRCHCCCLALLRCRCLEPHLKHLPPLGFTSK